MATPTRTAPSAGIASALESLSAAAANLRELQTGGAVPVERVEEIAAEVTRARCAIDKQVATGWPKPAAGVENLLARQAAWSRFRSVLEAGVEADALIGEQSNLESLHILREELPAWIRGHGGDADAARQTAMRIDLQIARTIGGRTEADLLAKHETGAIIAELAPLLGLTDSTTEEWQA